MAEANGVETYDTHTHTMSDDSKESRPREEILARVQKMRCEKSLHNKAEKKNLARIQHEWNAPT